VAHSRNSKRVSRSWGRTAATPTSFRWSSSLLALAGTQSSLCSDLMAHFYRPSGLLGII